MSTEANKSVVRRDRDIHKWNNLGALDGIVDGNIISHNGLPGLPPGLEGGKMAHMAFAAAFSDGHVTTEDLVAEGDKVVERFSFRGTNTGSFLGAPSTGKQVTATGVAIFRIANGKIVEHWGHNDAIGVVQQLGLMPTPGGTAG